MSGKNRLRKKKSSLTGEAFTEIEKAFTEIENVYKELFLKRKRELGDRLNRDSLAEGLNNILDHKITKKWVDIYTKIIKKGLNVGCELQVTHRNKPIDELSYNDFLGVVGGSINLVTDPDIKFKLSRLADVISLETVVIVLHCMH